MHWKNIQSSRLHRLFLEGFTAMDIAEPLISFDADAGTEAVGNFMREKSLDLVGIRENGLVTGYVRQDELGQGICRDYLRQFTPDDDLVPDTAKLTDVVRSLSINHQCFVTVLDQVGAIITLTDLEKPPMRMFLFGIITLGEMLMTEIIRHRYHDGSWQDRLSENRLEKAKALQKERYRRGQEVNLIDCLQYGDKGYILSYDEDVRSAMGHESRRAARQAIKEMESLRNNLSHTQEIVPAGWQRIVIACSRLEYNLEKFVGEMNLLVKSMG